MLVSSYRSSCCLQWCASHMMSRHVESHSVLLGGKGANEVRGCLKHSGRSRGDEQAPSNLERSSHHRSTTAVGLIYHVHIYRACC
jgi:hypothetical protein